MCAKMTFTHQPGTAMECLSVSITIYNEIQCFTSLLCLYKLLQIPITLTKESAIDTDGRELLKCGFKIGGGIDQDFRKSPQGYTDNVRIWFQSSLPCLSRISQFSQETCTSVS